MAQFASTLYPQTNPTNPILLALRSDIYWEHGEWSPARLLAWIDRESAVAGEGYSLSQIRHASRVLSRLAAFTG
jgi:hypothetical protein